MVLPSWIKEILFINNLDNIDEKSIDDVLCFHVLEHVPKPAEVFLQIARFLKKNGRLHLRIP